MAFQGIWLQRDREERLAHQTTIWLLAIATIFLCRLAEHRREYRRSGAAEQGIGKLAARGVVFYRQIAKNSFPRGQQGSRSPSMQPYLRRRRRAGPLAPLDKANRCEWHAQRHWRCIAAAFVGVCKVEVFPALDFSP